MSETHSENEHKSHQYDPEEFLNGMLFIIAGIMLLLNSLNIVPWAIWAELLRFWPVLIILAGLELVLGSHRASKTVHSVLTLIIVLWVVLIALDTVMPEFTNSWPAWLTRPIEWWEVIQQ